MRTVLFALALVIGSSGSLMAAAPLWNPPERSKKSSGGSGGGAASTPAPKREKPAKARSSGASSKSTDRLEREVLGDDDDDGGGSGSRRRSGGGASRSSGGDDEVEEDTRATQSVRRKARPIRRDDEEEEDEDADEEDARPPTVSLPVVAPRFISFGLAGSLMGRRFEFDAPLQQEKTFPRLGTVATLEAFPLMSTRGWFSRFGVGASYEREFGSASLRQADGGTLGYPITEQRWSFDVRYALQLGSSFVLVPLLGYGRAGYDIQRVNETTNPSMCNGAATMVCLPDVAMSYMKLGFVARVAFTPAFGMWLGAAYQPAFGLGRRMGSIGAEGAPSTTGLAGELGASWMLADWLALRASIPVVRYGYSWSGTTPTYRSASEMYYGTVIGAAIFTK